MTAFSELRLHRLHEVMAGHVDKGDLPGAVTVVYRHGEVHVDSVGLKTIGFADPVERDTIFRISSMTKPIIAAAAMILVEECRIRLDDPVDDLLPELANRRVLRRIDGPLDDTIAAKRPISLRDLLTFRMGFGQIMMSPETHPIYKAANDLAIGMGPPQPSATPSPDEWLRRLGTLPLMYQPGEQWMYNTGSDVLGVLIQRVSGQTLGQFLDERIFGPLGMKDTAFSVPEQKLNRFATSYWQAADADTPSVFDPIEGGQWASKPAFESGAGGLVSTADDYLAFGQMLLNCGTLRGNRLLSRPAVDLMTTDHLTPEQRANTHFFPGFFESHGWGFGVCVSTRRSYLWSTPQRYGWDGGLGTSWYTDPAEDLVGILMTQWAGFPLLSKVYSDFWTTVYQALED